MPFSLEKTMHIFMKTADGGVQKVVVKDKADTQQIQLIREHLLKISQAFKIGDFSDPIKIHGEAMPGLTALRKAHKGQLDIQYIELPTGGQISYSATSTSLIHAVHEWFDAQLNEHGHHAMSGHNHPVMHSEPLDRN